MKTSDLVICTGMSTLDIPITGFDSFGSSFENMTVDSIGMTIGGDAANEAAALTALGIQTKLYTAFSDDNASHAIRMILDSFGIDYSMSPVCPGSASYVSLPVIRHDAERVFITPKPGNPAIEFEPDPDLLSGAAVVTLGSLFTPPYGAQEAAVRVAKRAKANGSVVCADLNYEPSQGSYRVFRGLWPYVDYFFPNRAEGEALTGGRTPEEIAGILLDAGVGNVIVKIGREGCFFMNGTESFIVPPHLIDPLDSTGAGDSFCAGFITGLLEGKDHRECCRYANAAAALCIGHLGASGGIRSRAHLQEVLDAY